MQTVNFKKGEKVMLGTHPYVNLNETIEHTIVTENNEFEYRLMVQITDNLGNSYTLPFYENELKKVVK
jgi:hypothetical protein